MVKKPEPWISANEAAEIISKNSGRPVHPDYIRLVARQKPQTLASKPLDGRTNVYLRSDVEKIKVRAKRVANRQEKTQETSTPIQGVPPEQEKTIEQALAAKQIEEDKPWWAGPEQKESKTEESQPEAA
jgi:hypothetical protein